MNKEFVKLLFEMREDAQRDIYEANKYPKQRTFLYRSQGWVSCLNEVIRLYYQYHKEKGEDKK